ncbi:HAD-IA family hydrolase [Megasphaera sp. An286]|uniref:HAD-IA family hydrolase n=1 Tax=Megasphaera sp. An286 TaxID=1965622 RepID=UPI000B3BAF3A|nr:HAD-IA family hydrolase [Megasphaera sp. An286]OUO45673.1 hypothetical protein B5F80_07990 [Megasphaera sp. An286]
MEKFDLVKEAINRSTVVSFDLFDTLVKRDCYRPIELFHFVEQKVNREFNIESRFAFARIQAERAARNRVKMEEVSLEEIYVEISLEVSAEEKDQIRQWEEEYEYVLCQWNPFMKPVYEYCRHQRKKIFIVTDIYLPEILIRRILDKLGIFYDALFVSSTERKTKSKGTLFQEIFRQTEIKLSEILHIGDNKRSDYLVPKRLGMQAIYIPNEVKLNLVINKKKYKQIQDYANLCSFINNHAGNHSWNAVHADQDFNFFAEAGYEVQGPVLYGYVSWLQEQFEKDGIEKVFFLARDGQLMQKAYRKLINPISDKYIYASRKALIIPSLWMTPTIPEIIEAIFWGKRGTISSFLKKIGLKPDEFEQYYENAGFLIDTLYEYEILWKNQKFQCIFAEQVQQKMIAHSREMFDLLLQYLEQLDFSGKVAIVDIGWFGHMQGALEKIIKAARIPAEIHGYYLGLRPESPILDHIHAKGYLFDRNHNESLSKKEESFNVIVEMLFTADHGTTKGYKKENGQIIPILEKWEYSEKDYKKDYDAIHACQTGALSFVDDIVSEQEYFLFNPDSSVTFTNWIHLGRYPSRKTAELFGNLHFMDDTIKYLAKPKRKGYFYLFHFHAFLQDFRDAFWRSGFFVRTLGERFPYIIGYEMARKLYSLLRK